MKSIIKVLVLILPFFSSAQHNTSYTTNNGKTKISVNDNGRKFSMEFEGVVALSDDDSDIASISNNGYVDIKKSAFGSRRRIFIESENGQLIRKYYVGSKEMPFDPEGRRWLADIMQEVVRATTLGAEERVDRMYKQGGAQAVLREVGAMESSHVISTYLGYLTDKELSKEELLDVLEYVKNMDSSHFQSNVLQENMSKYLGDVELSNAYISTVGSIDSDHHKADILAQAVRSPSIKGAELEKLFEITGHIDSDHHKANILVELMENKELNPTNLSLLLEATEKIDSDHHKANILRKALKIKGKSDLVNESLLAAIAGIDSDHHKASLLSELVADAPGTATLSEICRLLVEKMRSDHHKSQVLIDLINKNDISEETMEVLTRAISHVQSDHSKGQILEELSHKKLSEKQLTSAVGLTIFITSDHTKAQALTAFAPAVRVSSSIVKEQFKASAEYFSSSTSQERILNLIK